MTWNEYVTTLLENKTFDGITISTDDGNSYSPIPPIIRASVLILDEMLNRGKNRQVMVFPETAQTEFVFVLSYLVYCIIKGKVKSIYDPNEFCEGEKLKIGNAVVQYMGMEVRDNKECIILRMADSDKYSVPLETLPMLQKTDTKRALSKKKKFSEERKKIEETLKLSESSVNPITAFSEYKTHMSSSVFNMTSVTAAKEKLARCRICGEKVTDLFMFSAADYEGNIQNVGSGQLSGIPAVVFTSDLYALSQAIERKAYAQMMMLNISNSNTFFNQLDAFDELIRFKIPVVCITNTINSMDLKHLSERGFNIWRWDAISITESLYRKENMPLDYKVKYCKNQEIEYRKLSCPEISESIKALMIHRKETQEQSTDMMKLYNKLYGLSFTALRSIKPFEEAECIYASKNLQKCSEILEKEKQYIPEQTYQDYLSVIQNMTTVYCFGYKFSKCTALYNLLKENTRSNICVVVPDNTNKKQVQDYWKILSLRSLTKTNISVLLPSEYYAVSDKSYDITVIVGWLKSAVMRKVIFSYNTQRYIVMLYDYETRWKKRDVKIWGNVLSTSNNQTTMCDLFDRDKLQLPVEEYEDLGNTDDEVPYGDKAPEMNAAEEISDTDELEEIELILKNNAYSQYASQGGGNNDTVEAIPVSFVGGYIAFYPMGRKLISATPIIMDKAERILEIFPVELKEGDFIVVREADKDIIRDLADKLLENSGKSELRGLATKWKEVLDIELIFTTIEGFYKKIVAVGCQKGIATVKRWIEDEDMIAPRDKQDLQYIAEVAQGGVLTEMLDNIYEAAQEIKSAHIQAGTILSKQLRMKITDQLKSFGEIDPFNFWEPIEMDMEQIGTIKVLKVIDVGSKITVESSETKHLIKE